MVLKDPNAGNEALYECLGCGKRVDSVEDGRLCECGGYLRNISVPRLE
jgi:hypothetical protein